MKNTTSFFAITKKTKDEADLVFNINCAILTKPVQQTAAYYSTQPHKKIKMLYTGNIDFGRFDSLNKIAKEIGENNSYQLDIYTKSFLTNRQKKKLNKNNVFIYKSIPQEQIIELQKQYDVLVFVESLSSFNKDARLSFSTKLVDYFSAGKCIFAVGNEDLAPISYLKDSNSALVATKKKDISSCLLRMKDKGVLSFYSKRSFELGIKKHSWIDIEKTFFGVVLGTVK